jgi:hypothetical protein
MRRVLPPGVPGRPGGEDSQGIVGGGAGLGGEDHEALPGAVGAVRGVAVDGKVTNDRVPVVLSAGTSALGGNTRASPPVASHRDVAARG